MNELYGYGNHISVSCLKKKKKEKREERTIDKGKTEEHY